MNTLRPFESYLDEVARERDYKNFEEFYLDTTYPGFSEFLSEAANRMCEYAFKAQKEICAEKAKSGIKFIDNVPMCCVDKSSILDCPTPFDNQNN